MVAASTIFFEWLIGPQIAEFLDVRALVQVRRLARESRLYDPHLEVEKERIERIAKYVWERMPEGAPPWWEDALRMQRRVGGFPAVGRPTKICVAVTKS